MAKLATPMADTPGARLDALEAATDQLHESCDRLERAIGVLTDAVMTYLARPADDARGDLEAAVTAFLERRKAAGR